MRSRNRLHKSKLPEFIAFCKSLGWQQEPPQGLYEVLRMRHPNVAAPMFVYDRIKAPEHYTTFDASDRLCTLFIANQRDQA